jgi:hypothetical protein
MTNNHKSPVFDAADAEQKNAQRGANRLGKKANDDDSTLTNWRPDPQE